MPNSFSRQGGSAGKPTRSAPLYTGRMVTGLWTNRNPLRDASTTRDMEEYLGSNYDSLIAGQNTEISNRATLIKRYGNSQFSANEYANVSRFYDFRTFNPTTEQIQVMIDTTNAVYALNPTTDVSSLVWTKSAGAQGQQTYFQGVGNTLFFSNGVDQKKWLQSLTTWTAGQQWNQNGTYPFLSTFLIDPNGNIQQLTAAVLSIAFVFVQNDVVQVFTNVNPNFVIKSGDQVTFPTGMNNSWLDGKTVTVQVVSNTLFQFNFQQANQGNVSESNKYAIVYGGDGTPVSGSTQPNWSTSAPSAANGFVGGITYDGSVLWTCRGSAVENWGIQPPTTAVNPVPNGSYPGWAANTYYSPANGIIDSNGNFQQIVVAGESGSGSHPTWKTALNALTNDSTVTWKLTYTAAMMNWAAGTLYPAGSLVIGDAGGTNCLFQSAAPEVPYVPSSISAYLFSAPGTGQVGQFELPYPTNVGSALQSASDLTSFDFSITPGPVGPISFNVVNSSGETTGTVQPFGSAAENLYMILTGSLNVIVPGNYTFQVTHGDGFQWGMNGGATLLSGSTAPVDLNGTQTAALGYPLFLAGHNKNITSNGGAEWVDTYVINFPSVGTYGVEANYARWDKNPAGLSITCNGNPLAFGLGTGGGTSGSVQPTWPSYTTADAPGYASVTESAGTLTWNNIGPVTDFQNWVASTNYALPISGTNPPIYIVDGNGFTENPYRSGISDSSLPGPTFTTTLNGLTDDNPELIWINLGAPTLPAKGSITTSNGGWEYCIALVNSLDQTVSNSTPVSASTGNFTDAISVNIAPGDGLQNLTIDPQADWVAVFRTTDGQATPFLVPGNNDYTIPATLPLSQYLVSGYQDTTPDTGLNNLISAPILGENTPPAFGAVNLAYYLNRLFYSIGATAYWTSGPNTPAGNGLNGTSPLNYDEQASLVKRIIPTTPGAIIFTVSDINIIYAPQSSSGTVGDIEAAVPMIEGTGVSSYNAVDVHGSTIGFFTTDSQFVILDPSNGLTETGFPLADQFEQNNGQPGQSWNPANVYVAWHISGTDKAWFVCDGKNGWFKLIDNMSPEKSSAWSPFSDIVQGAGAVQSIEVTPGVHKLLIGATGTGNILQRDLTTNTDNGITYSAYAVLGSIVLAQPGQVALVDFITAESVRVGSPLVLGLLVDEALPYYTGPFDLVKRWTNDPPNLKTSQSLYTQRFYPSELDDDPFVGRHIQMQFSWPAENFPNEILSVTVFGSFAQEN